jgi:alpha-L-fucosidase 2
VRVDRRGVIEGAAATALAAALPVGAAGAGEAAPHPQRLWYRRPATAWTEALPIGNGRLGAMVFGGVARERLQLNEDSLWSGGPYDPVNPEARAALPEVRRLIAAGRFAEAEALADARVMARPLSQMSYQPVGDLLLAMPGLGAPSDYLRELDLDAAVATTRFVAGGVRYVRRALASPVDQVIAVELSADRPGAIDLDVALKALPGARVTATGATLRLEGRAPAENGVAGRTRFAAALRVLPQGGRVAAEDGGIRVRGADRVVVLLAIATGYRRFDDADGDPGAVAEAQLAAAVAKGHARVAADAAREHRRLFRRVALDLGRTAAADRPTDARVAVDALARDPALATLYFDYARYLLIACSRPGGQPANLQGLWNDSVRPPWGSKYTININTQMNYWPAEPCDLGECVRPLVRMVEELAVTGARTARAMYGARGWVAHHNTDGWRATAPIDGARWGLWPLGGAWLCLHLWDRYAYGGDRAYLRQVYPLMAGAARFFLDTLEVDAASGTLVTSPSLSPENPHPHGAAICAGPAMDRQILRDLFDRTARAAAILGQDAGFAGEVRAARRRLAPDRVGAQGQLQEWLADWDAAAPEPHHRHVSHLYALFPSDQIDPDRTPALARAARVSLERRGDESTGWATAWRATLWARLRDGDHAHRILAYLLGPERTYPNLFDAHPPFQIDGNFGGARAIVEMLMASGEGELHLLPALPAAWPDGSVRGLRARGGARVDLAWRGGALAAAAITADRATRLVVRHREARVALALPRGRTVRLHGPDLRRGHAPALTSAESPPPRS